VVKRLARMTRGMSNCRRTNPLLAKLVEELGRRMVACLGE
jgi:hypothetical protein